jgi:hypothetical protein
MLFLWQQDKWPPVKPFLKSTGWNGRNLAHAENRQRNYCERYFDIFWLFRKKGI